MFQTQIEALVKVISRHDGTSPGAVGRVRVGVASSHSLPLDGESVDLVLTSPPYCTRIDYAVATLPELALLGYSEHNGLGTLRRSLIGSPTIDKRLPSPQRQWGATCNRFLDRLFNHPSKASTGYYYKNHLQYFSRMYSSLLETRRTLSKRGGCVIVVQDSYYKELHNDLPAILAEMARSAGLRLISRVDFPLTRTMARVNPAARKYGHATGPTESVLCFANTTAVPQVGRPAEEPR